jgi:hypothetical protein
LDHDRRRQTDDNEFLSETTEKKANKMVQRIKEKPNNKDTKSKLAGKSKNSSPRG